MRSRTPEPRVKIQQIHAAAQQDVLAVVDGFGDFVRSGGDCVRRGSATLERPRLEQVYLKAAKPSAAAGGIPASPPPAMRTLGMKQSVCHGRLKGGKVRRRAGAQAAR